MSQTSIALMVLCRFQQVRDRGQVDRADSDGRVADVAAADGGQVRVLVDRRVAAIARVLQSKSGRPR